MTFIFKIHDSDRTFCKPPFRNNPFGMSRHRIFSCDQYLRLPTVSMQTTSSIRRSTNENHPSPNHQVAG